MGLVHCMYCSIDLHVCVLDFQKKLSKLHVHIQYDSCFLLHVLFQLFVYLPDSGEQLKVGDLEITVDRMEYKTGYILRYITIATEQVGR